MSDEPNSLVLYSQTHLVPENHIKHLQLRPKDLYLENRIILGPEMYIAKITDLIFSPERIKGIPSVHLFREISPTQEVSFKERVLTKIFGTPSIRRPIKHNNKEYFHSWSCYYQEYNDTTELFCFNRWGKRMEDNGIIGKLKAEIVKEKGVVLSNQLLDALFNPLFPPIIETYKSIANF